jgi:hypothetical protein
MLLHTTFSRCVSRTTFERLAMGWLPTGTVCGPTASEQREGWSAITGRSALEDRCCATIFAPVRSAGINRLDYARSQVLRIRLRHPCWPPPAGSLNRIRHRVGIRPTAMPGGGSPLDRTPDAPSLSPPAGAVLLRRMAKQHRNIRSLICERQRPVHVAGGYAVGDAGRHLGPGDRQVVEPRREITYYGQAIECQQGPVDRDKLHFTDGKGFRAISPPLAQ